MGPASRRAPGLEAGSVQKAGTRAARPVCPAPMTQEGIRGAWDPAPAPRAGETAAATEASWEVSHAQEQGPQECMRVTCWDRPAASVSSSRQRLVAVPPSQIRPRRREGPRASRRALWGARGRPSLALGRALRRLGFFRPASLSTPPGPLPDPSTPRPHKRRLPVAVERASKCARTQGGADPSLARRHQREAGSSGPG